MNETSGDQFTKEKRKSKRVSSDMHVDYLTGETEGTETKSGRTVNVSRNGAMIVTNEPLKENSYLYLALKNVKKNTTISALGKVVYSRPDLKGEAYQVGIELVRLRKNNSDNGN